MVRRRSVPNSDRPGMVKSCVVLLFPETSGKQSSLKIRRRKYQMANQYQVNEVDNVNVEL